MHRSDGFFIARLRRVSEPQDIDYYLDPEEGPDEDFYLDEEE